MESESWLQLGAAAIVLVAYALGQWGVWEQKGRAFLWCNLAGSLVLGTLAARERQWGFLMMEVVWGLVTAGSLLSVVAPRRPKQNAPAD
ncbi:MAG: hypothetical protein ACKO5K_07675 [Armatimonadota bacterium]